MSNGTRLSHLSLATALASVGAGVQAVPRGYTDFTLFQSHASEYSVIQHDFDSATPGEIVDNGDVVDGITFSGIMKWTPKTGQLAKLCRRVDTGPERSEHPCPRSVSVTVPHSRPRSPLRRSVA
jgi:hypothetical protein